jgi:hypothetical protein
MVVIGFVIGIVVVVVEVVEVLAIVDATLGEILHFLSKHIEL